MSAQISQKAKGARDEGISMWRDARYRTSEDFEAAADLLDRAAELARAQEQIVGRKM